MPARTVTRRAAVPLLPEVHLPRFTGRDGEAHRITEALASPPGVILVEGEAGIGKTRLVRETLTGVGTGTGKVLMAVCPPFRQPLTLGPVVDGLRQVADTVSGLRLSALAGTLHPLFPEWADDLPPEPSPMQDAGAAQHRLFRALTELLDRLSVTVLVVDDAHWADEATLEFLVFLASRPAQKISLVITSRPEEISAGSLLRRLSSRALPGVTSVRLPLAPLDVASTASLVSSMLDGEQLSPEFARFLHERTGGLPLAVEESVRLLCDSGQLIWHAGEWERRRLADLAVPPTVRDSVLERVQRLSMPAQRVIEAAAVLADPVGEPVLAAVARLAPAGFPGGLDQALSSGLMREISPAVVGFRHVLDCQAVYEAVPATERRRLHLRAARALTRVSPVPVAALARHFREVGDARRWSGYAEQAADLALAAGDGSTAFTVLHDLLAHAGLPATDVVRLSRKVSLWGLSSHVCLAELAHRLSAAVDDASLTELQQAEARSQLGRILANTRDYKAGVAELERAIPHLAHHPGEAALAMVRLGWPERALWPVSTHRRWLERSAELMQDPSVCAGDRLALMADRAAALLNLGEESGWAIVARLPQHPGKPEEIEETTRICMNIGDAALRWGRYAEARRWLRTGLDLAGRHEYPMMHGGVLVNLAHLDWFTGAWEGLRARVAALVQFEEIHPLIVLEARLIAALLEAAAGASTAEQSLRLLGEQERQYGRVDLPLESAATLARLWLAHGRASDAVAVTEEPMRVIMAKEIWLWASSIAPVRVQALIAAGQREQATRLTASFARGMGGRSAPAPRAALATGRALVAEGHGDLARAATLFARAAKAWQALPRPYDALLAQERQAHCLLGSGQNEAGLVLLTQVRQRLINLGAHGDADRVVSDLREHGVAAHRAQRGGRRAYGSVLSPRELEVVLLLAAGRTNKEIARVLSRSPKTVETQLASASRKLGVTSRTALVTRALKTGVINGPR